MSPSRTPVGRASGKISGLAFGYVTDTRPSLVVYKAKAADPTPADTAFLQSKSRRRPRKPATTASARSPSRSS